MTSTRFEIGQYRVSADRGEIASAGAVSHVEPLVMDVLVLLAKRQGEVVSRNTLIREVWKGAIVSDDVISRCVYRLRKELGDGSRKVIKTVPKRGYSLAAPVRFLDPVVSQAVSASAVQASPTRIAAMVMAIAITAVALSSYHGDTDLDSPDYRVSVLPIAAGSVSEAGVPGPALAQDLLYRLGRNPDLTLLARTSGLHGSAASATAPTDANQVVLSGSIEHVDGNWILEVSLSSAHGGKQLWHARFVTADAAMTDMQQQFERAISQALRAMPESMILPDRGFASDDLEAYRLLLRGRELMQSRRPEDIAAAEQDFAKAAAIDPDYAAAFSSLAEAHAQLTFYAGRPWATLRDSSRDAVRRALQLQPELAHAHAVSGLLYYIEGDYGLAVPALRKAVELNPGYATAFGWLGMVYQAQGQFEDALAAHEMSAMLSPPNATIQLNIGMAYAAMGRYAEALSYYEKATVLEPDYGNAYWALAYAYWYGGNLDEAILRFRRAESKRIVNADFFAQYALACFDAGFAEEAERNVTRAIEIDKDRLWTDRAIAARYLSDGRIDAFVEHTHGAVATRSSGSKDQMDLALALALAGDWQEASNIYEAKYLGLDPWFYYNWDIDWGFSHALVLANVRRALGEPYDDLIAKLRAQIEREDSAETAGAIYLRASIAALSGDEPAALSLLGKARAAGWRRWWWTDIDPSWSELRHSETFVSALLSLQQTRVVIADASAAR